MERKLDGSLPCGRLVWADDSLGGRRGRREGRRVKKEEGERGGEGRGGRMCTSQ